jgi:enoyl-[acyl-carrier protein] reductase I
MALLAGKTLLVTGMLSNRSIAYGIAQACAREGARLVFTYAGESTRERTEKLAAGFPDAPVLPCDVTSDEQIAALPEAIKQCVGHLDGFVHAIAFAPREAIAGDFLDGMTRENFRIAHDVSSYSLAALAKALLPLMEGRAGAILTLTYLGGARVVPNYNTMGVAKASLDMNVKYLATSLGPRGIRVNGISAGPIKTLAAAGIGGFGKILKFVEQHSPLRRNVTIDDVGNVAAFLLSDYAAGVTGEITYVDGGFNIVTPGMVGEE